MYLYTAQEIVKFIKIDITIIKITFSFTVITFSYTKSSNTFEIKKLLYITKIPRLLS